MPDKSPKKEEAGNPTGDVAIIGDETREGTPVSIQLIQDIYNEFTGKTEEISHGYTKPFQASMSDLEQLNAKILQLQEQYSICSRNCSVTIYYLKDTRETFSSFERFKLYDASRLSPIESVLLKYDFLIKLPLINRLQNYTLTIRIGSRVTAIKKMKDEPGIGDFIPLRAFALSRTASLSINYVDYMVARNFQDCINGWVDGLEEHPFSKVLKFIQRKSHYIPKITKYIISGLVLYLLLSYLSKFLPVTSVDSNSLARFALLAFSSLFLSYRLAEGLGGITESAVDNFVEVSYLKLNRGDEREIKDALRKNQAFILRAIAGILGTLLLGILASVIANILSG